MIKYEEVRNIKKLAAIASDIWHEYWSDILSLEQIDYMVEKFQSEDAIVNQIKNEKYIYFFIKYNRQDVGYIGLCRKEDYLFLSKIYVQKQFRHMGIGTNAFEFIKSYAKSQHYNRIILTVNKNNTNTTSAYFKWGFSIIDSVVTDIGSAFVMDDYVMEYKIS